MTSSHPTQMDQQSGHSSEHTPAPRLTEAQIEQGWRDAFSTGNPFCPCDLKTFTKAARWAEANSHAALLASHQRLAEALSDCETPLLIALTDASRRGDEQFHAVCEALLAAISAALASIPKEIQS